MKFLFPGMLKALFLGLFACSANSEILDTTVKRYSLSDGLSQSVVYDVVQDDNGYIWFATGGGLNRFDGYEFKVFRKNKYAKDALSGDYIKSLLVDHAGTLWIGTFGDGLNFYNEENDTFTQFLISTETNAVGMEIYSMLEDAKNHIWLGTSSGLFSISDERQTYVDHSSISNQYEGYITSLSQGEEGTMWVGTDQGHIYQLDVQNVNNPKVVFHNQLQTAKDNVVSSILQLKNGKRLVVAKSGIFEIDENGSLLLASMSEQLQSSKITHAIQDSTGGLWVTTDGQGVFHQAYSSEKLTHITRIWGNDNSLSGDRVLRVYEDANQNIWLGTFARGVNMISLIPPAVTTYRADTSNTVRLSDDIVWSVFKDKNDGLWVGTDTGIDHRPSGQNKFDHLNTLGRPPHDVHVVDATAFLEIGDTLWIGTWNKGLVKYNQATNEAANITTESEAGKRLSSNTIRVLMHDAKKQHLWIGTHSGINVLDLSTGDVRLYSHNPNDNTSLPHNRVRSIYQDSTGQIWVGTSAGLSYFDSAMDGFKRATYPTEWKTILENRDIRQIYQDSQKTYWLATGSGLVRVDFSTEQLETYDTRDGLPNDVLYSFLPDLHGNFWVSTDNGLARFSPESEQFTSYYSYDGLQDNEYNFGAYFRDKKGQLYFGGVSGLSLFSPDRLQVSTEKSPLVIQDITSFDEGLQITSTHVNSLATDSKSIEFSHTDKRVEIKFAGLNHKNPNSLKYAYRLHNQDKNWVYVDAADRKATYTNLQPGKYVFEVSLTNRNHELVGDGVQAEFRVLPAFWQTLWFKLLATFITAVLIYLAVRAKLKASENRAQLLQAEVDRVTDGLKTSYSNRTRDLASISHDLGTPIAVINQMADSLFTRLSKQDLIDDNAVRQFELLRGGVDQANNRVQLLTKIANAERLSSQNRIRMHAKSQIEPVVVNYQEESQRLKVTEIPDSELFCLPEAPSLIVDNLVSNALKYSKTEQTVSLRFYEVENFYCIECTDLGSGIPPNEREKITDFSYRINQTSEQPPGQGVGLSVVKLLLDSSGGKLQIKDNLPHGTVITAFLPLATNPKTPSY